MTSPIAVDVEHDPTGLIFATAPGVEPSGEYFARRCKLMEMPHAEAKPRMLMAPASALLNAERYRQAEEET